MKNKQAIYLLFAANSISGFAQGITMIAIPWHYNNVLNLPTEFGVVNMIVTFLSLLWGLYGGTLIDKHNRKNVFMVTCASGFFVLGTVALAGFYLVHLPSILVSFIYGAMFFIYTIHYPNLFAFAQEITEPKDYGRIISWIEIQGQTTTAISMAFGAILYRGTHNGEINLFGFPVQIGFDIRAWELHEIFLLNAVTFFVAMLLISQIKFEAVAQRTREFSSIWVRLKTGFDYLKQNPLVFLFGTASFCIFVTILVIGFYLGPIYIQNHLQKGADVYASYEMYFAVGSLLAGVFIRDVFKRVNTVLAVIVMSFSVTAIYWLAMLDISLAVFYVIGLVQGFANAGTRIMRMTYLFHHIPNQIIGRTGGVFMTISVMFRLTFLFILSRQFLVNGDNVIYSYGILGLFVLASAIALIVYYHKLVAMPSREGIIQP